MVSPVEKAIRKVKCKRCGAAPGEQCQSVTGKLYATSHAERFHEAYEQNYVPISVEEYEAYYGKTDPRRLGHYHE